MLHTSYYFHCFVKIIFIYLILKVHKEPRILANSISEEVLNV